MQLKRTTAVGIGLLLLASPLMASASALSDLKLQVQSLITQLKTLNTENTTMLSAVGATTHQCPNLNRTHALRSRGNGVTALQQFLISKNLLSSDSATGYFGRGTEAAVKKFQCKEMGMCSGSANSNGYGVVGRMSRAKITEVCGGIPAQMTNAMNIDLDTYRIEGGQFGATASGTTPLNVSFSANTIGEGRYYLYFGDTNSPNQRSSYVVCSAGTTCVVSGSYTYTSAGTYTAHLTREYNGGTTVESVSRVTIVVAGDSPSRLNAFPSIGKVPLLVTFVTSVPVNQGLKCRAAGDGSYTCPAIMVPTSKISFGDGEEYTLSCTEKDADPDTGNCYGPHKISHVYRKVGDYTATLVSGYGVNDDEVLGEAVVTVSGGWGR